MQKFVLIVVVLLFTLFSSNASSTLVIPKPQIDEDDFVTLYADVSEESANAVIAKIHTLQNERTDKPIYLLLDSDGGSVGDGSKIIDAMQASTRPVYTVVIGRACSMAAIIHSYGVKRYMLPRATLMFHNASTTYSGDIEHMNSFLSMIRVVMLSYEQNISARSGVSLDELKMKMSNEWWIISDEALAKHLTDDIVDLKYYPVKEKEKEKPKFIIPLKMP